jgi:hypothetical protein
MFAFCPYRFWQIDRLHALSLHWTPFLFLALHRYLEAGGHRRAVLLAAAFVLQCLASVYVAYSTAVLLGVFLPAWLILDRAQWRRVIAATGVLATAAGMVALVYSPYAVAQAEMALARDPAHVVVHSVVPAEIGRALWAIPGYLSAKLVEGVRGAGTLGVTAGMLMCVGIARGGRIPRLYAVLALVVLLLSFGPVVVLPWGKATWIPGPYRLLHDYVPGFSALREPRRLTGFIAANGTIVAGFGVAWLLQAARHRRSRLALTTLLAALIAFEVGWSPLALGPAPLPGSRRVLYDQIAAGRADGAVVELPMGGHRSLAVATFRSAYHLRPLLNGYSSFRPTIAELRRRLRQFPDAESATLLRQLGVRYVLYETSERGGLDLQQLQSRLIDTDPTARIRKAAGRTVLVELEPLPVLAPGPPPGREINRSGWRVQASTETPAHTIDGELGTHWVSPVDPDAGGGWIDVDFGSEVEVAVVSLELASHYGEFPRAWRVLATDDSRSSLVAEERTAPAPLVSYRAGHRRVVMNLSLPVTRTRHLRIEVPPLRRADRRPPFDLAPEYHQWSRWGIHELRIYSPSTTGPASSR